MTYSTYPFENMLHLSFVLYISLKIYPFNTHPNPSQLGQHWPVSAFKKLFPGNIQVMFSKLPSGGDSDILSSLEEQGLIWKHELRAHS